MYTDEMLNDRMQDFCEDNPRFTFDSNTAECGRLECVIKTEVDGEVYYGDAWYISPDLMGDLELCERLMEIRLEAALTNFTDILEDK